MDADQILRSAICQYIQKNYEEALANFNQVISLNPNYAKAYHYRGLLYRKLENKQQAIEDLQKAEMLVADPEYSTISKKMQNLIDPYYSPKNSVENTQSSSYVSIDPNYSIIDSDFVRDDDGHWIPVEWAVGWGKVADVQVLIDDYEAFAEEERKKEFKKLNKLFCKQLYRSENAKFDREKLHSQNLPLCNSQASIAKAMGISIQRLRFIAFNRQKSHYIRFQIPKKTGGYRLSAPMNLIKKAQDWILNHILEKLDIHDAAHGFRRDRSIVTNAKLHLEKEVIINIDFKDFFPSISYKRVKGLFISFGYSATTSAIFALICTEPKIKEIELYGKKELLISWTERCLPQGAPTSPAISNLICRRLDKRLIEMAAEYGFVYTRYADDLTFSASGENSQNICKLFKSINWIVNHEGFNINEDKTRILRKSRQQEVTGVVVNSKLNVDRKTLKRFRATLYNIEKYGLRDRQWGQSNDLIASIQGFANFVYMVNPEKGAKLQEQVRRIKDQYENKKPDEPLTVSNLISLAYIELHRLAWSKKERRKYLRETYGKQSLQQLTDRELLEFLNYLKYPQIKNNYIAEPSSTFDNMISIDNFPF
ncbi:reverse transcriptase domain-containing protein [Aerosakkonema funiforme]|uniref:reverse transcriptase domain-containing protein n=1 Tax=Aerosakkonema funiforme TaxID=1246630 RepID=UPI0035B79DAF